MNDFETSVDKCSFMLELLLFAIFDGCSSL